MVNTKTIKNCQWKFIIKGSVADTRKRGHPLNSSDQVVVQVAQEMLTHSLKKLIPQAARESQFSFHCLWTVFKKELKWYACKPHYRQALSTEDCDIHVQFGEMMMAWYEGWSDLKKYPLEWWSNALNKWLCE